MLPALDQSVTPWTTRILLKTRITEQPNAMLDPDTGVWQRHRASAWALQAYGLASVVLTALLQGSMNEVALTLAGCLAPMVLWNLHSAWRLRDGPTHTLELADDSTRIDGQVVEVEALRVDWIESGGAKRTLVLDIGAGPRPYATDDPRAIAHAFIEHGGRPSTSSDPFIRHIAPGVSVPVSLAKVTAFTALCSLALAVFIGGSIAASTWHLGPPGTVVSVMGMLAIMWETTRWYRQDNWLSINPQGLKAGDLQIPWTSVESMKPDRLRKGPPIPLIVLKLVDGTVLELPLSDDATRDEVLQTLHQAQNLALTEGTKDVPPTLHAIRKDAELL